MRHPNPASRSATSLLEVLVVIAILTLLLGLLLPAVQQMRATAARMQCGNNLKQLSLAAHGFETAHKAFPAGVTPNDSRATYPYLGWVSWLLPHLEQDAIWQEIPRAYGLNRRFFSPPHVHPVGVKVAGGRSSAGVRRECCPLTPRRVVAKGRGNRHRFRRCHQRARRHQRGRCHRRQQSGYRISRL